MPKYACTRYTIFGEAYEDVTDGVASACSIVREACGLRAMVKQIRVRGGRKLRCTNQLMNTEGAGRICAGMVIINKKKAKAKRLSASEERRRYGVVNTHNNRR